MDRNTEAQIAAARGHDPCPNCGSADVTWRGRRWHESLRRAVANMIEWPFRMMNSASRSPSGGLWATRGHLDADRHWRLRNSFDNRVAALDPRIWMCAACGKRGEMYPEYADLAGEYGDMAELEAKLEPGMRPDTTLIHRAPDRRPSADDGGDHPSN